MAERRDYGMRGRIVQRIATCLASLEGACTPGVVAHAAGGVSDTVVRRVIKWLAVRGLVRNVAPDRWVAATVLKRDPRVEAEPKEAVLD